MNGEKNMKKIILSTAILSLSLLFMGCSTNEKNTAATNASSASSNANSSTNTATNSSLAESSSSAQNQAIKITLDQALEKYEEAYPDTTVTSVELDTSFGTYYYKIDGVDDTKEYELSVQAVTGEVKKEREETLDRDEQNGVKKQEDAVETKGIISVEEAGRLAEKEAGKGTAEEWKLEQDMGITYWEVKVVDGRQEVEVKVNAKTSEILERSED
jgi:uncharacterized membrane protein YkoI